jgi:hypothetical protein
LPIVVCPLDCQSKGAPRPVRHRESHRHRWRLFGTPWDRWVAVVPAEADHEVRQVGGAYCWSTGASARAWRRPCRPARHFFAGGLVGDAGWRYQSSSRCVPLRGRKRARSPVYPATRPECVFGVSAGDRSWVRISLAPLRRLSSRWPLSCRSTDVRCPAVEVQPHPHTARQDKQAREAC